MTDEPRTLIDREAVDEPPPEVAPLHPELLPTLQELDQDITGEKKFCLQAADSLRAFQSRWPNDFAVSDGYASCLTALDNMQSILDGAHGRLASDATQRVMGAVAQAQASQQAQAARDAAIAWAQTPPPPPPAPALV